jgi:acyl-CoA synthetase (AMP-forming)/AMP-acid ligase II
MPLRAGVQAEGQGGVTGKQAVPTTPRKMPFAVMDEISGSTSRFPTIAHFLRFRARCTPKATVFSVIDENLRDSTTAALSSLWSSAKSITFEKLNFKAEKIAAQLASTGMASDKPVMLLYRRDEVIEFISALFGCFFAGCSAIPVATWSCNAEDEVAEIMYIIENCQVDVALTTESTLKGLSKDFVSDRGGLPNIKWCKTNEIGQASKATIGNLFSSSGNGFFSASSGPLLSIKNDDFPISAKATDLAYVEFTKNAVGELKGVLVDHQLIMSHCEMLKGSQKMSLNDILLSHVEPRQQVGLLVSLLFGVFVGHHTLHIMEECLSNSNTWIAAVSKYKGTNSLSTLLFGSNSNWNVD